MNNNIEELRRAKLLEIRRQRLENMQRGQSGAAPTSFGGNSRRTARGLATSPVTTGARSVPTNDGGRKAQKKQTQHMRQDNGKSGSKKLDLHVDTRRGELVRAQRMLHQDVNAQATQHVIGIPVNKSRYNGRKGEQVSAAELKKARQNPDAVRIISLGGMGELGIGKNMTLIEYKNDIIVIDMGVLFADGDYPGINYLVPNIKYLENNMSKVRAILFTHAHLDHIGACRHLLPKFNQLTPVYGTEFTLNMIRKQMDENPEAPEPNYVTVDPFKHEQIKVSADITVEFVHTLHSIPGNAAIIVRTPNGNVLVMGDWRLENRPMQTQFDMPRLLEVSQKEGIDLMLNEATNIDVPGSHPYGEFDVGENIGRVMDGHASGRIIVSCFSSQINRIQLVLDEASRRGRKVAFAGFSMINNIEVALRSHQIKIPKDTIVKMEEISKYPDEKVVVVCTGSQGELNAVLNRMVNGAHKYIKIKASDTIVLSSSPIPGNEMHITTMVGGLLREGAQVIQHGKNHIHNLGPLHLSGHAYYEDHVKLVTTLKPKNYVPYHGEFYMLEHSAEMAEHVCGIPRERILVCDNGDIIELSPDKTIRKNGRLNVASDLYDDSGNIVHEAVVKDRIHISTEGIFVIVLAISRKTGHLLKTPDIISRAFIYLDDSEDLMARVRSYLRLKTERGIRGDLNEIAKVKQEIKDDISHILFDATGHTPIVMPVVNRI